jgi:hypothetical protein
MQYTPNSRPALGVTHPEGTPNAPATPGLLHPAGQSDHRRLRALIDSQALKPGAKVPSIRAFAATIR